MANYFQVGSINLTKKEDKLYINLNKQKNKDGKYTIDNIVALRDELSKFIDNSGSDDFKYGVSLQIEKPQDKITRLASLGYIDENKIESRLASIPSFIKYEITLITD